MSEKTDDINQALSDFKTAYTYWTKWVKMAKEDTEFTLGHQWKHEDVAELESKGVKALTINVIKPNINLLMGIESQNRTDYRVFPEGKEDSLKADIGTILIKNVVKNSGLWYKTSQQFQSGLVCGRGSVEPYLDFTENMVNGDLKFKKLDYNQLFPMPGFKEYDMSDCRYIDKVTFDLTREEILSLFPKKEKLLDQIEEGKINLGLIGGETKDGADVQKRGYNENEENSTEDLKAKRYDLLEHYYKKYVPNYFVLDTKLGKIKQVTDKSEADAYKETHTQDDVDPEHPSVEVVTRYIPEIWCKQFVGASADGLMADERAWFYPRWKKYHFMEFLCFWDSSPLSPIDRDLAFQGITRAAKDSQVEKNRRRTQELRHLNSSVNSGLEYEEDSLVNPDEVKKFGSTPGIHIVRKKGTPAVIKHQPTALSVGHSQMAAEHDEDIKRIIGVNTDLLSMQEGGTDSGVAISLRQKQGMVMVQKVFDNLGQTKWNLGKFILSQMGEVFDGERVMRVLGEAYVRDNFSRPVMAPVLDQMGQPMMDNMTGQPMMGPQIDPATGEPAMEIDQEYLMDTIKEILGSDGLESYDVAVGESASNETVKVANYMTLMDMVQKGFPIPPDVLVDESSLSPATKEKIKAAIEKQNQLAAAQPPAPPKGK